MITACKNNPHPNRVYFSIDPADRKILIPVQLNDSLKANMVFDTGCSEGTFSLDSLLIVQNPCLIPKVRPDTSLGGSGWVSEKYLNLEYKNINKKVKIGNTNLTFKNLQILNWKTPTKNDEIEGLFSIPKNDTTHVWELNFEHNYLEIHSIENFKIPTNCLLCPMMLGYNFYAIQIPMQITCANGDTLITNHIYLMDSAMPRDIALICPYELEFFNKQADAVWTRDMNWYVRWYNVKAKIFNKWDIDSLRIYTFDNSALPARTCLIGLNFLKHFNVFYDLKNKQIGLQPIKNFQRIVSPYYKRFHYKTIQTSDGKNIVTKVADYSANYLMIAGLKEGDEIIAVNGLPYNNYSSEFLKYNQDSILNAQLNKDITCEDWHFFRADTLVYDIIRQGKPMKIVVPVDKNEEQGD